MNSRYAHVLALMLALCAPFVLGRLGEEPEPINDNWIEPEIVAARRAHGRALVNKEAGEVVVEGVAEILMEDHFEANAHYSFTTVFGDDGETYRVDVGRKDAPFQPHSRVKLLLQRLTTAQQSNRHRSHRHQQKMPETWGEFDLVAQYKPRAPVPEARRLAPRGQQSILITRINMRDSAGNVVAPSYCDEACVQKMFWGVSDGTATYDTAGLYLDTSNGDVTYDEDTSKIVTVQTEQVADGTVTCDFNGFADQAYAALAALPTPIDWRDYTFRLFFIPREITACGWGGLAYVGCSSTNCKSWVRTATTLTTVHELGHSFGMNHASLDTNNDGTEDVEYGESADPLGSNNRFKLYNLVHRYEMQTWLPNDWVLDLNEDNGGLVDLYANGLTLTGSNQKMLYRMVRPNDNWYISLRTKVAGTYEADLPSGWDNQVYIHRWRSSNTKLVSRLNVGQAYEDEANGIYVSFESLTNNVARVRFPTCERGTTGLTIPDLSVTPTTCGTGQTASGTLTAQIENTDDDCSDSTYRLSLVNAPASVQTVGGQEECSLLDIRITADNYASETGFSVTVDGASVLTGNAAGGSTTVCGWDKTVSVTVTDSYGDGMCCGYGEGSYEVWLGSKMIATGGEFGSSVTHTFGTAPFQDITLAAGASGTVDLDYVVDASAASGPSGLEWSLGRVDSNTGDVTEMSTDTTSVTVNCGTAPPPSPSPSASPSASNSYVPPPPPPPPTSNFMETVSVTASTTSWTALTLASAYTSPIVVCSNERTTPPTTTRVTISGSTVQVVLTAGLPAGSANPSLTSTVHCMIAEEGVYTEGAHGVKMEAVSFTSTLMAKKNSWTLESRSYQNSYSSPVVVAQVASAGDFTSFGATLPFTFQAAWTAGSSRTSPPTSSALSVGRHSGELANTGAGDETVHYIVIESGSATLGSLQVHAGVSSDYIEGPGTTAVGGTPKDVIEYGSSWGYSASSAVVESAGMDGNDGGFAVLDGASPLTRVSGSIGVCIDEDLLDSERAHTTEQVSYVLMFNSGSAPPSPSPSASSSSVPPPSPSPSASSSYIPPPPSPSPSPSPSASNSYVPPPPPPPPTGAFMETVSTTASTTSWTALTLANAYTSPIVVCSNERTTPPTTTRVTISGSTVQVVLTAGLPAGSANPSLTSTVHCMIAEEGVYTEGAHGVKMEAVSFTSTAVAKKNSWTLESRSYQNSYSSPVVVAQVASAGDFTSFGATVPFTFQAAWAAGSGRTSPPTSSALSVGRNCGELANTGAGDETVHYIVIESGSATLGSLQVHAGVSSDYIQGPDNTAGTAAQDVIEYGSSWGYSASSAIVGSAGMDGGDGGWAVLDGPSPLTDVAGSIGVCVDEDQQDAERKHTTEQVSYVLFA